MKSSRSVGIALTALFCILFVGSLVLRILASGRAAAIMGPNHVAAGGNRVFVNTESDLFVLSASGDFLGRHGLPELIKGDALIDMRVLRDGSLLLAREWPAGLFVCDPGSWQCRELNLPVVSRLRGQFKVVADEDSGLLYISDFRNDIWVQPLAGGDPERLTANREVRTPNDIALDADGRLWVADSGNFRIAVFARADGGEWHLERSFDADHEFADAGRIWPMMLAPGADGNWWVMQPDPCLTRSNLLLYHPERGGVARIDLPPDSHPIDVAPLGDSMVVTDRTGFRLYRVDVATHAVSGFGDGSFQEIMAAAASRKTRYETIADGSLYVVVIAAILMVAGAFLATPKGRRWSKIETAAPLSPGSAPPSPLHRMHWLKTHAGTERIMRWVSPVSFVAPLLPLVLLACIYYFLSGSMGGNPKPPASNLLFHLQRLFWFTAVLSIGLAILTRTSLRIMRHRLGTDGRNLYVRLADGRQLSIAPERMVYGARMIAYEEHVFPTCAGNNRPLYGKDEVETYIAPLLGRATRLGAFDMFRYRLAHREPTLVVSLAFVAVILGLVAVTGIWKVILRQPIIR